MKKTLFILAVLLFFLSIPVFADEPMAEYYALYLNGSRCGYTVQTRQVDGDKVINTENMLFELERMGTSIKLEITETTIEAVDGRPMGFSSSQKVATMDMSVEGNISPDGKMKIKITNAGSSTELNQDYPKDAVMTEGLLRIFKEHGLEPGTSYSVDLFSPSNMKAIKMSFHVGEKKQIDLLGRVVELIEIKGEYSVPEAGSTSFTYYVDEDYNSQKMIMPLAGMNVEMVACSKSFALSKLEAAELIEAMVVKSPKVIKNLESINEITYTLKKIKADSELFFPETDNQKVAVMPGNRIRLTVRPVHGSRDIKYPYNGNDPEILKALESTQYLQVNHPEIIALAEKSTKGKKNALDAALAVEAFVSGYIDDKNLSVGYASALEVAKSRQGDCTEHAVLTAALCRAAGIPARVIMGIVYAKDDIFMGHAWTEAYIGDKWIGLDAALKDVRNGYGAAHITLAIGNGDAGDFFGMTSNIGKFTIENIKTGR